MAQIIESIPNISEGRDLAVVEKIVDAVRETEGCKLLDHSSDPNHNRSVITYIGDAKAVETASVEIAKRAAELIDLTKHTGEHPRMGAVDVMPFVPISGANVADCVELSRRVGKRIADEAGMPVFLYEPSATAENRKNLSVVRRGQFEGMAKKVLEPEWEPDFGGRRIHPTAGVVAVGARPPLIAYNLNLDTDDVEIAKDIAVAVREKDGGYKFVKAMGFMLEDKGIAQVSMNLTDFTVTPIHVITEAVKREAEKRGVRVTEAELIGLCPLKALTDSAAYYLGITGFDDAQVIENNIL